MPDPSGRQNDASPITVPESVPLLANEIEGRWNLPEFERGLVIFMPCCGFGMAAEHIDAAPGESMVVWPPHWSCPLCNRTYVLSDPSTVSLTRYLEEVE